MEAERGSSDCQGASSTYEESYCMMWPFSQTALSLSPLALMLHCCQLSVSTSQCSGVLQRDSKIFILPTGREREATVFFYTPFFREHAPHWMRQPALNFSPRLPECKKTRLRCNTSGQSSYKWRRGGGRDLHRDWIKVRVQFVQIMIGPRRVQFVTQSW